MARAAVLERLIPPRVSIVWHEATVTEVVVESRRARTIVFAIPDWPGHRAGQHLDVRLTAEDGYTAERSYSLSSAPEDGVVAVTVDEIEDGEVSPYLVEEVRAGDVLEVRGPIGGHFTWSVDEGGPLVLVAGGSGIVPIMAMLRHRARQGSTADVRLLRSVRDPDVALWSAELAALTPAEGLQVRTTWTRRAPDGWDGLTGRITEPMLADLGPAPAAAPRAFVCGPTPFVEHVADLLIDLGHDPARIHTERFGGA